MTRYLLTPSLYDSWHWYNLLESKEKQDFLNVLLKLKTPPTEEMLAGIRFENYVHAYCDGMDVKADPEYLGCVKQVADIVKGGLWQERIMFDAHLEGLDFLVYARGDVVKRDWIYDIKFGEKYEIGKYTESVQHSIEMKGAGINKFKYLRSDGDSVFHEDYFMTDGLEAEMWASLRNMIDGIMSDTDFRKAYQENWVSFGDAPAKTIIPSDNISRIFSAG